MAVAMRRRALAYLGPCLGMGGVLGLGGLLDGCASRPVAAVSNFGGASVREVGGVASQAGSLAVKSASAGWDTMGQTYNGLGGAMRAPLKDFNVVHSNVPVVLLRAKANPYDFAALNSCDDILNEVAQLDLALGPDVDNPKIKTHKSRYVAGADMASGAALDAAKSAVNGFIPMRGTIRKLTGAAREEEKQQKAVLAGSVRRGFLKSYGMQHNCAWPAAPMGFEPAPGGPQWAIGKMEAKTTAPPAPLTKTSPTATPASLQVVNAAQPQAHGAPQKVSVAATPSPAPYAAPTLAPAATGSWAIGRNGGQAQVNP